MQFVRFWGKADINYAPSTIAALGNRLRTFATTVSNIVLP
jgi:hypothetical protein